MQTSQDDGFREIQLSGKQLVFLFMAVTVVLVVTFLTGVLVGRGVRAERSAAAQAEATDTPELPDRAAALVPAEDPTKAAAPAPVGDDPDAPPAKTDEQPPEAAPRTTPASSQPTDTAADKAPAPPSTTPAAAAAATAKTDAAAPAPGPGYAVQVAAVNARGEADAIVKRLSGKSYAAYVESPKGRTSVFRVRVGPFKTRREALAVAERLKKDEKFKPWVTR